MSLLNDLMLEVFDSIKLDLRPLFVLFKGSSLSIYNN